MIVHWKKLVISLVISLGVGGLSAFFTRNSMNLYETIEQPALAPPSWLFPVVWSVLFLLMGISCYLVWIEPGHRREKQPAFAIYGAQLAVNFVWSLVFFNLRAFFAAFVLLIALWVLILLMIYAFERIHKTAGYLQFPYLFWVTFAGYLNLAIYLLNR